MRGGSSRVHMACQSGQYIDGFFVLGTNKKRVKKCTTLLTTRL